MTMTARVKIAPVSKSIRVNATQAHAFEVFTSGLGRWWPRDHGIGKKPMKAVVMETRLGGRWYELSEDGSQATVGKIIVWEPPRRFVMTWDINSQWKPDSTVSSEVEVRFIAEGANATRVEITIDYQPDALVLAVSDNGNGSTDKVGESAGHGLIGMRERVELFGGELGAGSSSLGGFTVRARLPTS